MTTTARLLHGNIHDRLDDIEDGTVASVVTSPPYWGRRNYTGEPDEIGRPGQPLDEYVREMVQVMRSIVPKLQKCAVAWVVIGDSASGSGGAGGDYSAGGRYAGRARYRQGASGLPGGTWCDVPGRLIHRLIDDGWLLRSDIIWDKGRPSPEDIRHVRRPLQQHERILMLTRSMDYKLDLAMLETWGRTDVWQIAPEASNSTRVEKHLRPKAPFPAELVDRCLRIGPKGLVLDPFMGSGVVLDRAAVIGLDSVGIDLDPDAMAQTIRRLDRRQGMIVKLG